MSGLVTTEANDRIAFDRRGDGPAIIFVAGAGPWRGIDPGTTKTADLLADRGVASIVYDRPGRGVEVQVGPRRGRQRPGVLGAVLEAPVHVADPEQDGRLAIPAVVHALEEVVEEPPLQLAPVGGVVLGPVLEACISSHF